MFVASIMAVVMIVLGILIHNECLQYTTGLLKRLHGIPARLHVLIGVGMCFVAHILEIIVYAFFHYALAEYSSVDHSMVASHITLRDFIYFSAETYTSLGYGDIELLSNNLRFLGGLEAMIGLVLIAWTASFTYFLMEKYWREQKHKA